MRIENTKCILFLLLIAFSNSWRFNNPYDQSNLLTSQQVQFFDQILDHFDYLKPTFWKQRYYVFDAYFDSNTGPVYLYICGEGICNGINEQSWTANLAKQTKGIVLVLEHRYYGQSLPFRSESLKTENLKFLNSEQALKDLAYFIKIIKKYRLHNVGLGNPVITVGGSYPGALSAWFRVKYPHLTVGAISSSGVVLAVEDFKDFDEQIYTSAYKSGQHCVDAIRALTNFAQQQSLSENRLVFQAIFKAERLTTREFMFYWSDVIVFQIQYGRRKEFCDSLLNKTLEEMLLVIKPLMLAVTPVDYGAFYLSNATYMMEDGRGGRSWYWQSCTQFSYFQTYSNRNPMRSKLLTIDFYRKWCEDIFGQNTWPFVSRTNNQFGGTKLKATNLIMTNGVEDPWRWASLQSNSNGITTRVINCTNCAHCSDLHVPNKNDDKQITQARDLQLALVKGWLSQK